MKLSEQSITYIFNMQDLPQAHLLKAGYPVNGTDFGGDGDFSLLDFSIGGIPIEEGCWKLSLSPHNDVNCPTLPHPSHYHHRGIPLKPGSQNK